jgi:hypothetical protein
MGKWVAVKGIAQLIEGSVQGNSPLVDLSTVLAERDCSAKATSHFWYSHGPGVQRPSVVCHWSF